jgi:hypothetical protein
MSARYARFPTFVAVGVYTLACDGANGPAEGIVVVVWANTGTGTTLTPSGAALTAR